MSGLSSKQDSPERRSGIRLYLGARINLGVCLDLLDTANTQLLGRWYPRFRRFMRQNRIPMPQNRDAAQSRRGDKVLRFRDCAVIDYALSRLLETERVAYQTVRGVFLEGGPAFPGFGDRSEVTHSDRG